MWVTYLFINVSVKDIHILHSQFTDNAYNLSRGQTSVKTSDWMSLNNGRLPWHKHVKFIK